MEARQSAAETNRALRSLAWARAAMVAGAVVGTAVGAGLGAVGFAGTLDETALAVTGGFIGLLLGLSLGLLLGFSYSGSGKQRRDRAMARMLAELTLTGGELDGADGVGLVLGLARGQRFWRLEPWNFLLVGIALGGLAGSVVGAELFLQGFGEVGLGLWTAVSALAEVCWSAVSAWRRRFGCVGEASRTLCGEGHSRSNRAADKRR